jgi:hypothetical protein
VLAKKAATTSAATSPIAQALCLSEMPILIFENLSTGVPIVGNIKIYRDLGMALQLMRM